MELWSLLVGGSFMPTHCQAFQANLATLMGSSVEGQGVKDVLVHPARIILESLRFFTTGRAYDRPTLDQRRACENFRSAS
jgi:hypothetical protein